MKKSKQRQNCWPLSAALASFSQGKWRGTRLSRSRSTAFTLNIKKLAVNTWQFTSDKSGHWRSHTSTKAPKYGFEPYLQIVTHLLAVRQALDLCGRAEIQSLPFVSETKGPRYPHVCYRQIVDVQQWAKAGQAEEKQIPRLVTSATHGTPALWLHFKPTFKFNYSVMKSVKCSSKLKNSAVNTLPSLHTLFPCTEKFQLPCRNGP